MSGLAHLPLLPTTLVGSWSQPAWLIDRARLDAHVPVRVTDTSLWRVESEWLAEAAPRVSGPIERLRPVEADVVSLMKRFTDKRVKVTLPGPFTMTQQAQNDYYASDADLAMAFAEAVAGEMSDLFAGCKYPSREAAWAKAAAMVEGAARVRAALA